MAKKDNGSQEIGNANNAYNQEETNSNTLFSEFLQTYYPEVQKLLPMLQSTVTGGPSSLMTAAEAPVEASTARALNNIQGNIGGTTNADALESDIALTGNQNAALAGDNTLQSALSAIQNLVNLGYGGVNTAQSGLNAAAGGEANLGENLQASSNAWWQSLLGGVGTAAGLMGGKAIMGGGGGTPAVAGGTGVPMAPMGIGGTNWFGLGTPGTSAAQTPSGTLTTPSSPISSGSGSTMGPQP